MMSPVHAAKPERNAWPLPRAGSMTITASLRNRRATSTVPSVDRPSTITTSSIQLGINGNTSGRFRASLSVGITTLTRA